MPDDAFSPVMFERPTYALVIGITEYRHSQNPDDPNILEPKNFRNLKVAAQDAEDFAEFLKSHGVFPANVTLLRNKEATAKDIKIAFRRIRQACKDPDTKDPLVIVYFSGHGMAEDDEHHYLVPFDGERDELSATAFSNRGFDDLLNELSTNNLIVFLDACHSGGMVGVERKDARGAPQPVLQYDSSRGLGGGTGRIVIASCKPGQSSFESGRNGIFTGKLLSLLKGELPYFKDKEKIGVFDLFDPLSEEVDRAAFQEHNEHQEPQINAERSTGFVLAINLLARDKRIEEQRQAKAKRQQFLEVVLDGFRDAPMDSRPTTIALRLRKFVEQDHKDPGYESFYKVFEEHLSDWAPGANPIAQDCCDLLIVAHGDAIDLIKSKIRAPSQKSAGSSDTLECAPSGTFAGQQALKVPVTPTPASEQQAPPPVAQQKSRGLSSDDREYILGEMRTKLDYWLEQRSLEASLCQPITEEKFAVVVNSISSKHSGNMWDATIARIVDRFHERWSRAPVSEFEAKTPCGIRLGEKKI